MKEKILDFIKKTIENKIFKTVSQHFLKPFAATLALALLFYIIIYNQNETTGFKDGFIIYYAMLWPFLINSAISFARLEKRKQFAAYGLSVVAVPFLAVNGYWLASKYSQLPAFYREFNESGSFFLLYIIYSVFFVIGGVFIGLIDEFISSESMAVLKYPESGSLSKSKRRKLKKKKRDSAKSGPVSHEIIDEIIGDGESDEDDEDKNKISSIETETEFDEDDDAQTGPDGPEEDGADSRKDKNDTKGVKNVSDATTRK